MDNIYNNLNYFIETTNINLDDLCEVIGVTPNLYINDYNEHKMSLSIVQLNLLSDLFLIDVERLMFDDLTIDKEVIENNKSLFALSVETLKSIITFHKVVKNYIGLNKLQT